MPGEETCPDGPGVSVPSGEMMDGMTADFPRVESRDLHDITVGLIAALVADRTGVTNTEALRITREVTTRYARLAVNDESTQEVALQALYEARSVQNRRDAMTMIETALDKKGP